MRWHPIVAAISIATVFAAAARQQASLRQSLEAKVDELQAIALQINSSAPKSAGRALRAFLTEFAEIVARP